MQFVRCCLAAAVGVCLAFEQPVAAEDGDPVSLTGIWRFALDSDDVGMGERWFAHALPDEIQLPGILQSQGYGNEISATTPWVLSLYDRDWHLRKDYQPYAEADVMVPFLCQPPRHYLGAAWYQRDVEIPPDWQGRRVVLTLERPHWATTVWTNDKQVGTCRSLCTPHEYDLGQLEPGSHQVTIRVDNRLLLPYRPDAHSVSDSLGSSWNGIVGRIELTSTSPVWIADAQVFPDIHKRSVRIQVEIGNSTSESGEGTLSAGDVTQAVHWTAEGGAAELEVALGASAPLWDEFHPALERLELRLQGPQARDRRTLVFGLRELRTEGNEFLLNGRKTCFRGTHDGGDFPLTGYPPTDVDSWKRIIRTCQQWGLNHMRFHSWCPPEAAFTAADELGFYLQVECGMWNVLTIGTPLEAMMYEETERVIRAYGNHPSFLLLSPSNEPKGHWQECLTKWVEHCRKRDPRRLYTTGTGWSLIEEPGPVLGANYLAVHRIGQNMLRGERGWFGRDYSRSLRGVDVPVVSHETGQWCAYPDFEVIDKFTGYMRPGNYEIFRDSLAAHGMLNRNMQFAHASGQFQLACYKEEIEASLRTPGLSGFQLLDLHDYVGQGTALVGLLDPFWESKGYVEADEFREFCGPTVPLARLKSRVFTTEEPFSVELEVAHYGENPLQHVTPRWAIVDTEGKEVARGELPERTIPLGNHTEVGTVTVDLKKLAAPAPYRLKVSLAPYSARNSWNFWLYPADGDTSTPDGVLISDDWSDAANELARGGRVLFVPRQADLSWDSPPLDRVPIFWNRLMVPGWSRMLGLWCDVDHQALQLFPTASHCDWQWTQLTRGIRAMNLDRFPSDLQPIVQAIDDWNRNYKLGVVFECRVGSGRLMVCTLDITDRLANRPVARQLRRSLLQYMTGPKFEPRVSVSAEDIASALFNTRVMRQLGAQASGKGNPAAAIDGNPGTAWIVAGEPRRPTRHPYELTVSFPEPVAMIGVVCVPRQDNRDHQGDIRQFVLHVSDDGQAWREIVRGELASTFQLQTINFENPVTAAMLRLTALSGYGSDDTVALAELAICQDATDAQSND